MALTPAASQPVHTLADGLAGGVIIQMAHPPDVHLPGPKKG